KNWPILNLIDEKEEVFQEEALVVDNEYKIFQVGRCLTDIVVHFPSMRNMMADLWHPFRGYSYQILVRKVVFKWDISLRATTRRRSTLVSRWFREADGLVCKNLDKESVDNGHNGRDDRDMRLIWRDDLGRLYPNLNNIPLGPRTKALRKESINQQNMGCEVENWVASIPEPIDLILEGENDPFDTMNGNK
ncbi:hypothetical protein Gogos_010100, partial [Gossypium gossypioides]|nr:hypothetical protein [Gossypium gossypioides]